MYDYKTSYPAYKESKDRCREIVFEAIKRLGECTDKEISEFLGWPINRVTPRRGELVTEEKVQPAGRRKSNGRLVNYWKVRVKFVQAELF